MVVERGAFDTLVTAYRAEPSLLRPMLKAHLGEELRGLAASARDSALLDEIQAQISELNILTRREQEVLALLGDGCTNREIATALVISEVTAKVHVRHILEKLGARSRTEAALKAARLLASRPER
jgi:DNA-binding NarL/FixJ family response regulator